MTDPVSASHAHVFDIANISSLNAFATSHRTPLRLPDPHVPVPRSVPEHTHQPTGHAAADPAQLAGRVLRLTFTVFPLTVRVHSPAAFMTAVPGLPWLQILVVLDVISAICASTYALFAASRVAVGVATFIILLFAISSDLRMVVVPFTSSVVSGTDVFMPILPELLLKSAPDVAPGVPDGGLASVHAASSPDQASMSMKTLFDILISVPRRTTL